MKKCLSILLAVVLVFGCAAALAEYPAKEITYVCGYGAGGSSDMQARLMQPYAEKYFGVPMVIENIGGAGGTVGLTDYHNREADGYAVTSFNTTPLLYYIYGDTDYDYFAELDFLCCVITTPIVVAVKADSPYQTIEDLIAAGQADPGALFYASAGAGSITHVAAELWKYYSGLDFTHVACNGGTDALTALMNGTVDFDVASLSEVLVKHEEGELRILASCTDIQIKGTDGVTDLGIPVLDKCDVKVIQGVAVNKAADAEKKAFLAEAFKGVCTDEGYVADMAKAGYSLDYMDAETFAKYLYDMKDAFTAVINEADLWDEVH